MSIIDMDKIGEALNTKADVDLNNTGVFSTSGGGVNLVQSTPSDAKGKEVVSADFSLNQGGDEYIISSGVSGTYSLQTNMNYQLTIDGATTFAPPTSVNEQIVNQIMVHIWMPSVVAINWGDVNFVNGEAPDVSTAGGYFVYYQKIPFAKWLVGAYKEST